MVQANCSLFPRNKFAKRHYEAIALAMQDARFHLRNTAFVCCLCRISSLAALKYPFLELPAGGAEFPRANGSSNAIGGPFPNFPGTH